MAATVDGLRAYLRLPEDNTEPLSLYLDAAAAKAKAAGIRQQRAVRPVPLCAGRYVL